MRKASERRWQLRSSSLICEAPTGMATWGDTRYNLTLSPWEGSIIHLLRGGSGGRKSKYTQQAVRATRGKRNWPFSHGEVYLFFSKPQAPKHTSSSEVPAMTTGRGPALSGPHPTGYAPPRPAPPAWVSQAGLPFHMPAAGPQPPHPEAQPHLPSHSTAVPLSPSQGRKLCTLTLKLDPCNYLSILVCPVLLYHFF